MQQDDAGPANGHAVRSAETQARLVEAAITLFGAAGFEAVSTRQLAEKAAVGLASITYHFGGKAELFEAAVASIEDYCRVLMQEVAAGLPEGATPAARLEAAASAYFTALFAGDEPQSWVNFLVRCATDAPAAYDRLFAAAFGPLESALTRHLAAHHGLSAQNEQIRLRACMVTNSLVAMRINRAAFLRHLGWRQLGGAQLAQLDQAVRDLVRSDFMLGRLPAEASQDP